MLGALPHSSVGYHGVVLLYRDSARTSERMSDAKLQIICSESLCTPNWSTTFNHCNAITRSIYQLP
jgi:hypothetical protein